MAQKPGTAKARQSRVTVERLIAVAFDEFSQKGYAAASTEAIVQKAGVTRGALYHHFKGKKNLFYAVFRSSQAEIGRRIAEKVKMVQDPWGQLTAGCNAFLEACTDAALQQIVVIDAPAVLDGHTYREVDQSTPGSGFALLQAGIQELIDAGLIKPLSADAVTHLLSGAMNEAALWIARSGNAVPALAEARTALQSLLSGLRV